MVADGFRDRITPGTFRTDRLPRALREGYFLPEGRSTADHLARSAAIARGIRFVDTANMPAGTWAKLFAEEPAAIMADLLALSAEDARADFAEAMDRDPETAARDLVALARRVRSWLQRAASRGRDLFAAQLDGMRSGSDPFSLATALAAAETSGPAALAQLVFEASGGAPGAQTTAIGRARATRQALLHAHDQLLNIVATLRPNVEKAFETRLDRGEIDPALGLILSQIGLYGDVAETLNRFPDRHTDFYYRDILGLAPRPAAAEAYHLRFDPGPSPVSLPAGTALVARAPGLPAPLRFRLTERLNVAPVRIGEICSLRYRRDPLISPQSELGFVTGVTAGRISLAEIPGTGDRQNRIFAHPGAEGARMGVAVASPLLALSGGHRRITVGFRLAPRPGTEIPAPGPLLAETVSVAEVRRIWGRLLSARLIEGAPWPEEDDRARLLSAIRARLGGAEAAELAARYLGQPRDDLFQTLLQDSLTASLTSEAGEIAVPSVRLRPNAADDGPGFRLDLTLPDTLPAITAPPGEAVPVLELRLAAHARFSPVSLLEPYALDSVSLAVDVTGLTRLTAFSDDGPLSIAQPFLPFGPRPQDGAAFYVGAPELAGKPVTRIGLEMTWADLPRDPGGYAEYYRSYGPEFHAPDPKLGFGYLTAEGWKDLAGDALPMLRRSAPGGPYLPHRKLAGQVPGRAVGARGGTSPEDFRQRQTIRAGLARLTLACGPEGFGHAAHPLVLAEAMRSGSFRLRRKPLPPPPLTPKISAISLDYSAEGTIELDTPQAARPGERILQIGPFGRTEIFPQRSRPGAGILPPRIGDGALMIRLEGAAATGQVSILFEMQSSSHRRRSFRLEPVSWHYLSTSGWQPLPNWSLGTDTTEGLMRTGIVTIDVPNEDVLLSGGEMPGEGVWLAAAANGHLDAFPRLASVSVNGARIERLEAGGDATGDSADWRWSVDPPVPGIGTIAQVGPAIGGTPPEGETAFRARVAEGLRHRQRAVTAWDIERIALDAFPEIWQVKCLPGLDPRSGRPRTGAVTVVVVPGAPENAAEEPSRPAMFDVLTLRRIEAALRARAGASADITVRNPSYERLQIRARVGFAETGDGGAAICRLKLDLSRFLSVWCAPAPLDSFGWSLNLHDVTAFVRGLDYVRFLTRFSILHLTRDESGTWRLYDTAREAGAGADGEGTDGDGTERDGAGDEAGNGRLILRHREPWSLPLPMPDHWITTTLAERSEQAEPTGIGGLGIGETLVVEMVRSA